MKHAVLFGAAFVTLISCEPEKSMTLKDDSFVNQVFDQEETNRLDSIVMFFDRIVVNGSNEQDINKAYREYFANISTTESFEVIMNDLESDSNGGVLSLIDELKETEIFHEIWHYSYGLEPRSMDTLYLMLSLNNQSKYLQLLDLLGNNDKFLKDYRYMIASTGSISPVAIATVMKDYKEVNFKKPVNRLVWAMHYITVFYREPYRNE